MDVQALFQADTGSSVPNALLASLPPLRHVDSSCIAGLAYRPLEPEYASKLKAEGIESPHGFLIFQFHSGSIWAYLVPSGFKGLVLSGSAGKAYNRILKGKYPGVKLA